MSETEVLRFLESHNGWVSDDNLNRIAELYDGIVGGGSLAERQIDYQIFLNLKGDGFIAFNGTQMQPGRQYKMTDAGRNYLQQST
jgi:hypothetical protein